MGVVHRRNCDTLAKTLGGRGLWVRLTQGDWGSSALILVTVLIKQSLELLNGKIGLIHQHMIVSWACCSLDSNVRAQVDIVLPRVGDIVFYQCTWHRITILIPSSAGRREKSNMMALLGDYNSHFWL